MLGTLKDKNTLKMKNKKSITGMNMLIALLLGVFVFLVVAVLVPNLFGKSNVEASDNIQSTGDFDEDGISNYFDKCKCKPAETDDGCKIVVESNPDNPNHQDHNPYKDCPKEMCPSWKPKTVSCV